MKPSSEHPLGTRGFTLVELLLTLTLLAVVLSLVAPRLSGMLAGNRTDGVISRVSGDIMTARMEAIRRGRRVDFVIYDAGKRAAVVRSALPGGSADTIRKVILSTEFPGVTLSPTTLELRFDSRGLVSSNGTDLSITATQGDESRTIQVSSVGTVYRD